MSNSCILFRKFHFLIGSFDHLCSTREISMWNCGTASSHKCCAIQCWDVRQGDTVSLSFRQMRSTQMVYHHTPHTTHHSPRQWQIHMKLKQHSLENGKLLRNSEKERREYSLLRFSQMQIYIYLSNILVLLSKLWKITRILGRIDFSGTTDDKSNNSR